MPWITTITNLDGIEHASGVGTYPRTSMESAVSNLDSVLRNLTSEELRIYVRTLTFTTKFKEQ